MRTAQIRRYATISASLVLLALGLAGLYATPGAAGAQSNAALVVRIEDAINPGHARFIARVVEQAYLSGASLLIIELDTHGGHYGYGHGIVRSTGSLRRSLVPVAVFVSPAGAQTGLAGTFIVGSAHIAAMAPGSTIGAGAGADLPDNPADLATRDAAFSIRNNLNYSGSERRSDRDVEDALEQTILTAASYTADEALDANIIDYIADDTADLLAQMDGATVWIRDRVGKHTLHTDGLDLIPVKMQWRERLVNFITNPNIAFLLLTIACLGLVFEMLMPRLIVPGVAGAICLGLAFLALNNVPFNWIGVAFIVLALGLAALEIFVSGYGALGLAAAVSLIIGGLLLFGSLGGGYDVPANFTDLSVSRWLLAGVGAVLILLAAYPVAAAIRSPTGYRRAVVRRGRRRGATDHLIGQRGVVTAALQPRGLVDLSNETWSAISNDGLGIPAGRQVQVVGVEGMLLTVAELGGVATPE